MAVHQRDVEIQSPCPVKLDPDRARGGVRSWYCGHCEKSVHVLSNMTEKEARSFLDTHVGQDVCVTYAVRRDGSVRFRPEPKPPIVPISALTRPRRIAAAAGLGMALAACTPHERDDLQRPQVEAVDEPVELPTPVIPHAPDTSDPDEVLVDGELPIEPDMLRSDRHPEPVVQGGITAKRVEPTDAIDEPCDDPKADETKDEPKPRPMVRGRIRTR